MIAAHEHRLITGKHIEPDFYYNGWIFDSTFAKEGSYRKSRILIVFVYQNFFESWIR